MRFVTLMACVSAALAAFLSTGCSSTNSPSNQAPSTTEIEGTWSGTMSMGGNTTITFTGSSFSSTGSWVSTGTFSVATGASPKQVNITLAQCSTNPDYEGKTTLGVYALSGQSLVMAMGEPGTGARGAFGDGNSNVFTLTKQ
jgi:uncharacterized protein (TIGR03067 family)